MKFISEHILNKTKWLVFKTLSYLDKNGNVKNWDMVSRVNNQAAVMIVPIYGNQIVVIKEFRAPINNYEYGFPAGLIDPGETVEQAVVRELKEETGLDVIDILTVSPPVYNSSGLTDEAISIAYVKVGGNLSKQKLQEDEDIETKILTRMQVAKLLKDKTKCFGAKSWIILNDFANSENFKF